MRYFIVTVVIIFLMLIGAVVLVSRNRNRSADDEPKAVPVNSVLTDYITSASEVRYIQDGKIVGDDQHRAIRISISDDKRELEILQGYDGQVIDRHLFSNDRAAYDVFMYALANAQFIAERKNVKVTDEKGVCPTGRRYIYELRNNDETVKRLWNVSCNTASGTFAGQSSLVRQLFQQQIPDYHKLTGKVSLN